MSNIAKKKKNSTTLGKADAKRPAKPKNKRGPSFGRMDSEGKLQALMAEDKIRRVAPGTTRSKNETSKSIFKRKGK